LFPTRRAYARLDAIAEQQFGVNGKRNFNRKGHSRNAIKIPPMPFGDGRALFRIERKRERVRGKNRRRVLFT